jgi:hypothetical protein
MNQGLPFRVNKMYLSPAPAPMPEPQRKTIALSKECLENLDILMRSR